MMHLHRHSTVTLLVAAALLLFVGACQSTKPQESKPQSANGEPRPLPFVRAGVTRQAKLYDTSPISVDSTRPKRGDTPDRKLSLPDRTSNREKADALQMPYPDNLIKGVPDAKAEVQVTLAFNAAELPEVVAAFAAPSLLNFSYLVDPAVKGAVTLSMDTRMTAKQAWETFEHILWLTGAYASMNSGFIHILPFDKMPQERRIFADHDTQPNVVVDFVPVRYKSSAVLLTQIKPFLTEGASVVDVTEANSLIIIEAPANIAKVREILSRLDSKGEREWPCAAFQCYEAEADEIAEELLALLPILGFPVANGTAPSGGAVKIIGLPRIGCIVVSAALPEVVAEVGKWIKALDRDDIIEKEEIFLYNAQHATAEALTTMLETFFNATSTVSAATTAGSSRSSSRSSSSTRRTSSTSSTSTNRSTTSTNRNTANRNNSNRNNSSSRRAGGTVTGNSSTNARGGNTNRNNNRTGNNANQLPLNPTVFETEVTIYADAEHNRLTIKTTPRTMTVIKSFLERHDIPARQVSIKAIITDITLDKSTEFGVSYAASQLAARANWEASGGWAGAGAAGGLLAHESAEIITAINNWASSGLGLFIHKNNNPLAIISAVAGEGNTKILSEPQLVVKSGEEGYLQAGEQIAVPTETTNYNSSSGNTSTNYEYKDIGVIMTVTPTITAGNEVQLSISQEVSAVKANSASATTSNSNAPDFTTKKVSTVMTVKDTATFLMGGMIKSTETTQRAGIPFLRDIPYLGLLFGYDKRENVRTELLILVTVNVIDNDNFQDDLVRRYKASLEDIEKRNAEEKY